MANAWQTLGEYGCDRALMGGIALASWNHPRATRDVDLLVAVQRSETVQLVAHLSNSGLSPKKQPPLNIVGGHGFLHFLYTPPDAFYDVQLDLMLAESDLQQSALERKVSRDVPGIDGSIQVLSCEDLVLFKLISGRLIDQADAAMLFRENRTLDNTYLSTWLRRLNLSGEVNTVWREAFPDEPCPF